MSTKRIDKGKVSRGGATKRKFPSRGATWLVENNKIEGRTLDYGCGYGLDSSTYGWDSYDPYYNPTVITGTYDTIVCTNVLSAVSRLTRVEIIDSIKSLLTDSGRAYIVTPRNLPQNGKLSGYNRRPQHNVILFSVDEQNPVKSVFKDESIEIYELTKKSAYIDKTND